MRKRQIARLIQAKEMGNSMNNSQTEILNILQEECAEVIQAVSKIRRFGEESNRVGFIQELADLQCMINLCFEFDIVGEEDALDKLIDAKRDKLKVYSNIFEEEPQL
jgi:NTP pyrophosphatase (non-canonical NTP hydrolase)